ncbi:integrin alpha-3-like [Sardina pilchardus]|uniref:integrin alpha-3-like n=1 Tax=Sardina pilchardus TaxID=27697 RepID=UPI002E112826
MAYFHLGGFSVDLSLLLLTLLHGTFRPTDAFNLDVRFPVVKEGKTNGSLFGLSVAFHKQTMGEQRYLVLVGAPKEETKTFNQTGDAFYCPISMDTKDCGKMNLVTSGPDQPDDSEIVNGMWLGVAVASQNITEGRVLVCGHRYVKKTNEGLLWAMIGRCYIRSNNMNFNPDDYWQEYYEVCSPQGLQTMEGMCNMGISAGITANEVVVGSPGSYDWQGNADIIWRSPHNSYSVTKTNLPKVDRRNIYIGYSVAKDKGVLSLTSDTLVAGAPRDGPDNLARGAVRLNLVGNVDSGDQTLGKSNILYGEQVGSYFGGSVAIVDLNNDNWKDLIVGAPFYFDRTKEEGGAVYIYMNENGSFKDKYDIALKGPEKSAFGMSVAAIGDINQDGFQDFAVGAPYHGTGAVFIWMGSEKGISPAPSQVIKGQDIKHGGFQTFGYSVSGGMDIDDNKYPDIVVGSLDERIAVLRARPVIHLQSDLSVTPDIVDPETCNDCVEAKMCVSYLLSTGENSKRNITVEFTLTADRTSRQPRLLFLINKANSYTGYLNMPSERCKTFKLQLKKPIRDKVEPVSFSLNVSLYEPRTRSRGKLQNLDAYPVLSEGKTVVRKHEIHFQKACGTDNKCNSNLKMTAQFANFDNDQPFEDEDGHQIFKYNADVKKLKMLIDVTNIESDGQLAEDAHNTVLNITIPPSLQFSAVNPKTLIECEVKSSDLLCEFVNPVRTKQESRVMIIFETLGITLDTREISTEIQLSTLSEQSAISPIALTLMVEYSLQPTFSIDPQIIQTYFSGTVKGETAMKTASDVGSPVTFTFHVQLKGKPLGSLGSLLISFDWPLEVANGKWLLYLTNITTEGTSNQLCVPPDNIVNPLHLTSAAVEGRRKRELDSPEVREWIQAEQALAQAPFKARGARKKPIRLDCDNGAKCRTFTCPLKGMKNHAAVTVHARLWNTTMLEDYTDAYRVTVRGHATLNLQTTKAVVIMKPQTQTFTLNIDPELEEEAPAEAPIWIIVVSVLAGVLLLTLISLLLWKCGFFRRASTRELYEAKAQTAEMRSQPSEKDRLTEEI